MSNPADIPRLLIDTSSWRGAGLDNPDLRKLLRWSKEEGLKVYLAEIAWEELRTQLLEKHYQSVKTINKEFRSLTKGLSENIVLGGLPKPEIAIWDLPAMAAASKAGMERFAREHRIEVVKFNQDHATRAWSRYFEGAAPFNFQEEREKRRKDIPDSWILEVAIDLVNEKPGLLAMCMDGRLGNALREIGAEIFGSAKDVVDHLEKRATEAETQAAAPVSAVEEDAPAEIEQALTAMDGDFRELGKKIFGFIAYLQPAEKKQLFTLLANSGIPVEKARNVADRLAISNLVKDLGNHYVVAAKSLAAAAMVGVEDEVIRLLADSIPH